MSDKNSHPRFQVHHKDGNPRNNEASNLELKGAQIGETHSNSNIEFPYRCPCGAAHSAWLVGPMMPGETAVIEHDCGVCGDRSYMLFGCSAYGPMMINIIRNTSSVDQSLRSDSELQASLKAASAIHKVNLEATVWAATYAQAFAYLKLKDANGGVPNERHAEIAAKTADESVAALGKHGPKS